MAKPKAATKPPAKRAGDGAALAPITDLTKLLPVANTKASAVSAEDLAKLIASAQTAEEAFQLLHRGAGLVPFANKMDLSEAGTVFTITAIGLRPEGGYEGDDDVALSIVTRDGEPFLLTFEQNPGRNEFLAGCYDIVKRFGSVPSCALQRYDKQDGTQFFAIVPASRWSNGSTETIEA